MKTTAMMFACAFVMTAQELPQEQQKFEAARKRMDEVFTAAVSGNTFQFVGGQMLGGSVIKGAPYSAEAVNESTQVLADGNRIVNRNSSMIYRDSDGRERREESIGKLGPWSAEGGRAKAIFISDPVAKTNYSLDEKSRTAMKTPGGMPALARLTAGPIPAGAIGGAAIGVGRGGVTISRGEHVESHNGEMRVFKYEASATGSGSIAPKTEKLGTQMIEGVSAEGTRETITIPAGQIGNDREMKIVSERWYSPELQVTVMSKHSDPRNGETVYKLTNINRSEPPRTLFEVPADYTVDEPKIRTVRSKEDN